MKDVWTDTVTVLRLEGPLRPAVPVSSPKLTAGVPTQLFKKELIKTGRYVKESANLKFVVTGEMLSHWADTFQKMKAAGVAVPVPADHSMKTKDNLGYVTNIFVEGESLFGLLEMTGEDAILMALRNDVSLLSPPAWTDGSGNVYTRPIVHVSLTPYPVIPGLKDFEPIAASFKEIDMDWAKFRETFEIDKEVDDDKVEELILASVKSRAEKAKLLETELAEIKRKLKELQLSRESGGDKSNGAGKSKDIDPLLIKLAGENRLLKLQQLVNADPPAITPAVATKLSAIFAEGEGLTLSLANEHDPFDQLIDALQENTEILEVRRQRTGPQLVELSQRLAAGSKTGDAMVVKDAEDQAKAASSVTRLGW